MGAKVIIGLSKSPRQNNSLQEIASGVIEHPWLQNHHPLDGGLDNVHIYG